MTHLFLFSLRRSNVKSGKKCDMKKILIKKQLQNKKKIKKIIEKNKN